MAGLVALAGAGAYFLFRKKPEDSAAMERERRAYLNRIGRIVEGHILEVVDTTDAAPESTLDSTPESKSDSKRARDGKSTRKPAGNSARGGTAAETAHSSKRFPAQKNGAQKLLYYTYSISGVTYETAQDVSGFEEQAHLKRIAVGQSASVKYDPSNPSNSILLADDWSGIH